MRQIIRAKMNGIFVVILLLWRLVYFAGFMILQTISMNDSMGSRDNITECTNFMFTFVQDMSERGTLLAWALAAVAVMSFFRDCFEFLMDMLPTQRVFLYNISGKKTTIAQNQVYDLCMFLSDACVFYVCILHLIGDSQT